MATLVCSSWAFRMFVHQGDYKKSEEIKSVCEQKYIEGRIGLQGAYLSQIGPVYL